MDIELLNEFIVLKNCLNYRKASDQLFISQSVLSRHIQSLENQLGVELFTRDKHSVILTSIGEIFASDAEKVIAQYKKATEHIQMYKDGSIGKIELTTSYALSSLFIYDFLPEFNKNYPNINVHMNIKEVDASTKKDVAALMTDMAILMDWEESQTDQIACEHFFKNSFYAFFADNHPLSKQSSVTVNELSGLPMIYLSSGENRCSVNYFHRLFEKHHSFYNPCIAASSTEDIFVKILTQNAVSILSETVFRYTPQRIHPVLISDADAYIYTNLIWSLENPNKSIPVFSKEFALFARKYNIK